MSWDEVGKSAKYMGITHHRNVKRVDPEPPPPKLPGKATGKKARRNFSFSYERRSLLTGCKKWQKQQHWTWYATERQRDDAMRKAGGFMRGDYEIRNVLPVNRCPPPTPSGDA